MNDDELAQCRLGKLVSNKCPTAKDYSAFFNPIIEKVSIAKYKAKDKQLTKGDFDKLFTDIFEIHLKDRLLPKESHLALINSLKDEIDELKKKDDWDTEAMLYLINTQSFYTDTRNSVLDEFLSERKLESFFP